MNAWKRPEPTPLRRDFFEGRSVSVGASKIALATFRGEAAATHELLHVFPAIEDAAVALLEAERAAALILDFRELKYDGGDEMGRTLSDLSWRYGSTFPVAVIVSDLNREGLTSLLRAEMGSDPAEWLVDSEKAAIGLLRSKLPPQNA
jgi:hypothetical protein